MARKRPDCRADGTQSFLHQARYYLACFSAMVFNDTVFSGWALPAFTLNVANILFVLVAVSMLIKHFQEQSGSERITHALRIFPACLLAAFACATWGALAQEGKFNMQLATAWGIGLVSNFLLARCCCLVC